MVSYLLELAVATEVYNLVNHPKLRVSLTNVILNARDWCAVESALCRSQSLVVILASCALKHVELSKLNSLMEAYPERLILAEC